jgi:hypothetical protein
VETFIREVMMRDPRLKSRDVSLPRGYIGGQTLSRHRVNTNVTS